MRTILPIVATVLVCTVTQTRAHDLTGAQLAQAQSPAAAQPAPAAAPGQPAPAAPAPQAAPALQVNPPDTAAAPDSAPSTKTSKPAKKRVAKRGRSYESDEARARSIAAKYGVTW